VIFGVSIFSLGWGAYNAMQVSAAQFPFGC